MIPTGSEDLDKVIEGYKEELNYIYGPPGSGKTTLCKMALINQIKDNKKVIYIDTENGFSLERLKQLAGSDYKKFLDHLIIMKIKNFEEQCAKISRLKEIKNIKLIIIDSLGNHYRENVRENPKETNSRLVAQLKILKKLAKEGCPVVMTNQVYSSMKNNEITPVGGEMVGKFCRKIIELKTNPRKLIQTKPFKREILFNIENNGLVLKDE